MLIFLFLQFSASASASVERIIEQGEDVFKDSASITYPQNFEKEKFNQLIQKIGYVYPPFSTVDHVKHFNNQLMFSVRYYPKDYGLRLSSTNSGPAKFHFIVAGDSNVFGEGCSEEETLTSKLTTLMPGFHIYNFGHRGGAPHNTLSLWEHFPVKQLITEKKGIFLYDLFSAHMLERIIGGKNYVAWDNGLSPWYELNSQDVAVYRGQFKDKLITSVYAFIARHKWMNWLFPVLPRINSGHIHLIARIFVKMRQQYLQSFPEGRFVVLFNNSTIDDKNADRLQAELKKENIETLTLPFQNAGNAGHTFKDMHFNPEGQKWQAGLISKAVLKIFPLH